MSVWYQTGGSGVLFFGQSELAAGKLQQLNDSYRKRFARRYSVRIDLSPSCLAQSTLRRVLPLLLRSVAAYRRVDSFVLLRGISLVYPFLKLWKGRLITDFTRKHTMGIDVFFK